MTSYASPSRACLSVMRAFKLRRCLCFLLLVLLASLSLVLLQTALIATEPRATLSWNIHSRLAGVTPDLHGVQVKGRTDPNATVKAEAEKQQNQQPQQQQPQQQQPQPQQQQPQPEQCRPVTNVAFIKTHKAGSSTIANILQRYGINNNLNFALPNKRMYTYAFNYLVKPGERLTPEKVIPLPKGQQYNILWSHSIYNQTTFRALMPNDTVYISILRHPFQQFVSTFEYYKAVKILARRNPEILHAANPISAFLRVPGAYEIAHYHFGYIRNKQAEDLGMREKEFRDNAYLTKYLKLLEKEFSLMMITEHFDESLLMLRKLLCWGWKDILYILKNKNKNKPKRTFLPEDEANHVKLSSLDYALYRHFYAIFEDKMSRQGEAFHPELVHFRELLALTRDNCVSGQGFSVKATQWHGPFEVTQRDCLLMLMSEIQGLKRLLEKMDAFKKWH